MEKQIPLAKRAQKFERMGLEKEVISYLIWMKLKQRIAQKKNH